MPATSNKKELHQIVEDQEVNSRIEMQSLPNLSDEEEEKVASQVVQDSIQIMIKPLEIPNQEA